MFVWCVKKTASSNDLWWWLWENVLHQYWWIRRLTRDNFTIVLMCLVTDSLWIKPKDALNSSFIGITTLHVSGSLSSHHQEFLAVHRLWYILRSCDEPFATRSRMELRPTPGSKRSQLHEVYQSRCTAKNSWWWAERLPETCRVVIPIKLEFSASVGFIHREFLTGLNRTLATKINFSVYKFMFFS